MVRFVLKRPPLRPLIELLRRELRVGHYRTAGAIARLSLRGTLRRRDMLGPQSRDCTEEHHLALGEACELWGAIGEAEASYRAALAMNPDYEPAHTRWSIMRLPGDWYDSWLRRLYSLLEPETLIEIGVAEGNSLAMAPPRTLAIGVDPDPKIVRALGPSTHVFAETSDAFFGRRGPDALLAGRPLGVGFIDGLHLFEQALRDFINLESYCGAGSIILLHDTIPLNEATQSRVRTTIFHTGDVWKAALCLKHYRPELDVFTVATPPSGLTVVTGMNPGSRVLAERYREAVDRFIDLPYSEIERDVKTKLDVMANDWPPVEARLRARGVVGVKRRP